MAEEKKVAWNASQGIINEISNRRTLANSNFIRGDIKGAFYTLISMKQSVIQSFTESEREKLRVIEEKFFQIAHALSKSYAYSFNKQTRNSFNIANKFATRLYTEYNNLLMDLLSDRGYLVGEQADASRMRF